MEISSVRSRLYISLALMALLLLSGCGSTGPTANNDTYTVSQSGQSIVVSVPGVLDNDTGGPFLSVANADTGARTLPHGTLTLNADGSFNYAHNGTDWDTCFGSLRCDSFTYKVNDGTLDSVSPATVTLIINQPPDANTACLSTPGTYNAGDSFGGTLPGSDPEGGALFYDIPTVNDSLKGLATTDTAGNFSYAPLDAGALGMDKFTYNVTDDQGLTTSGTAWVFIGGTGNNPPPAVRIMPLGDSITAGVFTSVTDPPAAERVAYRRKLYEDLLSLANGKYNVDFVGQYSEGLSASPPIGDPHHQGTPGQRDDELASNVGGYLDANKADILLMHIGTNNFDTNAADVETALNNIDTWEGANYPVTIFLARIIDDVANYGNDLDVPTFNANVATMVSPRSNDRVLLVDMQNGAGLDYGDGVLGADMADNLHPNQQGYDKMAAKWYQDLTNPANVGAKYLGLPQCP